MLSAVARVALLIASAAPPLRAQTAAPPQPIALRHVNVVDVRDARVLRDHTIVAEGGHIAAVLPPRAPVPESAHVVDGGGAYAISGLWDTHVHLSYLGTCALPVFVANGVTSVRDAGARMHEVEHWRDEIARGTLLGPRILAAGPNIESGNWLDRAHAFAGEDEPLWHWGPRIRVDGPAYAPAVVDSLVRLGVDFVKFRNLTRESFLAVASAARRRGLPLAGHAPDGIDLADAADAHLASVEHAETISLALGTMPDAERARTFAQLARRGVRVTPTLITEHALRFTGDGKLRAIIDDSVGATRLDRRYVSERTVDLWRSMADINRRTGVDTVGAAARYAREVADIRLAVRAGVPLLAGTDVGSPPGLYPGASLRDELELLVHDVGLSPAQALRAATIEPPTFFGLERALGEVAAGGVADLLLLDGNPLADLANLRRIRAVMLGGRLLERSDLDAALAKVAADVRDGTGCAAELPDDDPSH